MNFSFWPFLWFGLPGRLLSKGHADIFETPCDRDPPTGNFKNLKFFKNSLKILNDYFWGQITFTFGEK